MTLQKVNITSDLRRGFACSGWQVGQFRPESAVGSPAIRGEGSITARPSWSVYLAVDDAGTLVKVGFSLNPEHRITSISALCLEACVCRSEAGLPPATVRRVRLVGQWNFGARTEARVMESHVHDALDRHGVVRIGEWFALTPDAARPIIDDSIRGLLQVWAEFDARNEQAG